MRRPLFVLAATNTDVAITFFTSLTVLALLVTLGIVGLAAMAHWTDSPSADALWREVRGQLAQGGLGVAWLVAAVCTSGSLYFSEVANFTPCRLCWAQRACMYPLVLILVVATVWPPARRIGLALAVVGAAIAGYHILVERFPSLESSTCDPENPCSLVWFERLGFITLPVMALTGFACIITLLLASGPLPEDTSP